MRSARTPRQPQTGLIGAGETMPPSHADVDGWTCLASPIGDARMGWVRMPLLGQIRCNGFAR